MRQPLVSASELIRSFRVAVTAVQDLADQSDKEKGLELAPNAGFKRTPDGAS